MTRASGSKRFFFVSGIGWEYPPGQSLKQSYPIQVNWTVVLEGELPKSPTTSGEIRHIEIVRDWVAHPEEIWSNALLSEGSLWQYLPAHAAMRRRSTSAPIEGKGKKLWQISLDFDDDTPSFLGQSSARVYARRPHSRGSGRGIVVLLSLGSLHPLQREGAPLPL